ncbi:hypothetical protein [Nocardia flavorosea]|uniref:Trypsin n=1 Tax=Nocardia flavorosea TaxID=53429 RepID=A0A846YAW1_9NOCA|nr:hypothetical protein [Nocardia flavorosea]NKY55675.1 hypothetical protein [Nocardia flavorosea]
MSKTPKALPLIAAALTTAALTTAALTTGQASAQSAVEPGSAGSGSAGPGSAGSGSSLSAVGPGSTLGLCSITATGYADRQPVALTAGHCTLGLFGVIRLPDVDWAMIPLSPGTPTHNTLPSGERLTGLGAPGGALCRWGQRSGTRCDGYTGIRVGDSGGPVYRPNSDGTANLVGITSSNIQYSSLPPGFSLS